MFYNFSKEAENVVEYATKLAARSGGLIATEHLLAGVLQVDDSLAGRMKAFGMPRDGVLGFIDMNKARTNTIRVTDNASRVFRLAQMLAERMRSGQVYPVHIFLAILKTQCRARSIIESYNIDPDTLFKELA